MKILLVSSSFAGGGITSYALEFIRCFSQNHELSVILGSDKQNPIDRQFAKVYYCDADDTSLDNAEQMLSIINEKIQPDVIVNSNSVTMSLLSPYIGNNVRIINISHSLRYNEADIAGCNSQYVDSLVALSTFGKKYLDCTYKCGNKVSVVYNFVNDNFVYKQIANRKKKARKINIVFSGGTTAAKTPELVFKVIRELLKTKLDFNFYFLGAHSPTLKSIQPYKSIKELLPKDSRLIMPGRVPREQALEIMNKANIFLCPSRREGCPMAMIEAMRGGAIIITSDFDNACKEMIKDGYNGFVIPHKNIKLFVSRIIDIIINNDRYSSIYDNSYINYSDNFSFLPWKEKMEVIVNTTDTDHTDRLQTFSEEQYMKDIERLKKREQFNKYHMILFETLKSAVPFFIEYIKKILRFN